MNKLLLLRAWNSYWHWRRFISLVVLITFSGSLLSPVFASYQLQAADQEYQKDYIGSKTKETKASNKKISHKATIVLKPQNNQKTAEYFSDRSIKQQNKLFSSENKYQPYLEIGGARYFNQASHYAAIYDLFIPLWQKEDQIIFADLRIFDRRSGTFEGNAHVGFRKLLSHTEQMLGVYASFDRKITQNSNKFNQLTFGFEYWLSKWFVGGNFYQPIGSKIQLASSSTNFSAQNLYSSEAGSVTSNIAHTVNNYEVALGGGDAELGYAVTEELTTYAGGFRFTGKNTDNITGPRVRVTYDYQKSHGRILGILDGVGIEAGAQHDAVRGNVVYASLKLKIGITNLKNNSNVLGFDRHMIEPVRRDPDIVNNDFSNSKDNLIGIGLGLSKEFNEKIKNKEFTSEDEKALIKFYIQAFNLVEPDSKEVIIKQFENLSNKDIEKLIPETMNLLIKLYVQAFNLVGLNSKEVIIKQLENLSDAYIESFTPETRNLLIKLYVQEFSFVEDNSKIVESLEKLSEKNLGDLTVESRQLLLQVYKQKLDLGENASLQDVKHKSGDFDRKYHPDYLGNKNDTEARNFWMQKHAVFLKLRDILSYKEKGDGDIKNLEDKEDSFKELSVKYKCDNKINQCGEMTADDLENYNSLLIQKLGLSSGIEAKDIENIKLHNNYSENNRILLDDLSKVYTKLVKQKETEEATRGVEKLSEDKEMLFREFVNKRKCNKIQSEKINPQTNNPLCTRITGKELKTFKQLIIEKLNLPQDISREQVKDVKLENPSEMQKTLLEDLNGVFFGINKKNIRRNNNPGPSIKEKADEQNLKQMFQKFKEILEEMPKPIVIPKLLPVFPDTSYGPILRERKFDTIKTKDKINRVSLMTRFWHGVNQFFSLGFPMQWVLALEVAPQEQYLENETCKICDFKNFINATSTNFSYELIENKVEFLEQAIIENSGDEAWKDVLESAVIILTNHAVHYTEDQKHVDFLIDLAKSKNIALREEIIKTFASYIKSEKKQYNGERDSKLFDSFAQLLQYDFNSKILTSALIDYAYKLGYTSSIEAFPYFEEVLEKLWDNEEYREKALFFIVGSLRKLLLQNDSELSLIKIEKSINNLINKTGQFPPELLESVFENYIKNQNHFTDIVVDLLAEDKQLSSKLSISLVNLVDVVVKIKDPKVALFIALRLFQNHVDLPPKTLEYFTLFLSSGADGSAHRGAINLYYKIAEKNPGKINFKITDALIKLFPKASDEQQSKISVILDNELVKLSDEQKIKYEQQQKVKATKLLKKKNNEPIEQKLLLRVGKLSELFPVYKNVLTTRVNSLLGELKWPAGLLLDLIEKNQGSDRELAAVLEKLADYKITPEMIDRKGRTISEILNDCTNKKQAEKLLLAVNYFISDNRFFASFNDAELLKEFKEDNKDNTKIVGLINNNYFARQLAEIDKYLKKLSNWTADDFVAWKKSPPSIVSNIDEILAVADFFDLSKPIPSAVNNIVEVLAILSQAISITTLKKRAHPRHTQLLTLLSLLSSPNGELDQIGTGEGKTIITTMQAAIKVIEGHVVDIITSADVLAKRDAENNKKFFNLLNISVGHNIYNKEIGKPKSDYGKDVVYGDMMHFVGDYLSDITHDVKMGRGFDILIMDEVDNLVIDQNSMKIQLSKDIPGFDVLSQILVYMWTTTQLIAPMLKKHLDPNKCIVKKSLKKEDIDNQNSDPNIVQEGENWFLLEEVDRSCFAIVEGELNEYVKKEIFNFAEPIRIERQFIVPNHLEQFVSDQLPNWIRAIAIANMYEEDKDYVIEGDNLLFITPVDIGNGVHMRNLQISDGVHQFLQLKHALTMTPESIVNVFMSFYGFFNKYKGRIYGLTGTLGTPDHRDFIRNNYDVSLSIIPLFIHKDLLKLPTIIATNKEEWQKSIIDSIWRMSYQERPVLVIFKTIKEVKEMEQLLIKTGYERSKIYIYGDNNKNDSTLDVNKEFNIGVILSTNLGGRGTDLRLTKEAKINGGLHVVGTSLYENVRPEDQYKGRPARQGDPGSEVTIFNAEQLKIEYADYDINKCLDALKLNSEDNCLNKIRDKKYKSSLDKDEHITLPGLKIGDEIFALKTQLIKKLNSPTGYQILIGNPEHKEPKHFYLYKDNGKFKLQAVNDAGVIEDIVKKDSSITELIRSIDPQAYRHINAILNNNNNDASSLNKLDNEVIHFIAVNEGYVKNSEIYTRAKQEFDKLTGATNKPEQKINYLKDQLTKEVFEYLKRSDNTFDSELLEKVESRKLFLLWLEDEMLYNHEYETMQLDENFGFWFRKYNDPLILRNEHAKELNQIEIGEKLKNDFVTFEAQMLHDFTNKDFIKNPAYKILQAYRSLQIHCSKIKDQHSNNNQLFTQRVTNNNYLSLAESQAEAAINLDLAHSSPANVARGYVSLLTGINIGTTDQNSEAQAMNSKFYKEICTAINSISSVTIRGLIAEQPAAGLIDPYDTGISRQVAVAIEVNNQIIALLQKNAADAKQALGGKSKVVAGDFIKPEELAKNITKSLQKLKPHQEVSSLARKSMGNVTEAFDEKADKEIVDRMLSQVVGNGLFLFDTRVEKLQEASKNWWGTVLKAAMGVVFIVVGCLVPVSGVFMSALMSSLVAKGIGDVIGSIISVITGVPVSIKDYLQSTAMSIGIALVTAGVLAFVDRIAGGVDGLRMFDGLAKRGIDPITGEVVKGAAESMSVSTLINMATTQVVITGISAGAYEYFRRTVDQADVIQEANNQINNLVIQRTSDLNKISAAGQMDQLYTGIGNIAKEYLGEYNSDGAQFIQGVATSFSSYFVSGAPAEVGLGGLFSTAADMGKNMIKNIKALPAMINKLNNLITEVAAKISTWSILQARLTSLFTIGTEAIQISAALIAQNYTTNIVCSSLGNVDLSGLNLSGSIENYQNDLVSKCNSISSEQYDYSGFKQNFVDYASGAMITVQKSIRESISNGVGIVTGTPLAKMTSEAFNNWVQKYNQEKEINEQKQNEAAKKEAAELEKNLIDQLSKYDSGRSVYQQLMNTPEPPQSGNAYNEKSDISKSFDLNNPFNSYQNKMFGFSSPWQLGNQNSAKIEKQEMSANEMYRHMFKEEYPVASRLGEFFGSAGKQMVREYMDFLKPFVELGIGIKTYGLQPYLDYVSSPEGSEAMKQQFFHDMKEGVNFPETMLFGMGNKAKSIYGNILADNWQEAGKQAGSLTNDILMIDGFFKLGFRAAEKYTTKSPKETIKPEVRLNPKSIREFNPNEYKPAYGGGSSSPKAKGFDVNNIREQLGHDNVPKNINEAISKVYKDNIPPNNFNYEYKSSPWQDLYKNPEPINSLPNKKIAHDSNIPKIGDGKPIIDLNKYFEQKPIVNQNLLDLKNGERVGGEAPKVAEWDFGDKPPIRFLDESTPETHEHHIFTNKNYKGGNQYSVEFERIFNQYDFNMNGKWNRAHVLNHKYHIKGGHPKGYHNKLLEKLRKADEIANGNKEIFLNKINDIISEVKMHPEWLDHNYWPKVE